MHNLINQRFGHLVVIKRIPGSKWLCRCDCGNEKDIHTSSLLSGATKSCGCIKHGFYSGDITGQRFGHLTVLARDIASNWRCRCDCGNEITIPKHHLVNGENKSCGCMQYDPSRIDITGQRFGHLIALKPTGKSIKHSSIWLFKCDCGREVESTIKRLIGDNILLANIAY